MDAQCTTQGKSASYIYTNQIALVRTGVSTGISELSELLVYKKDEVIAKSIK